MSAIKLQSGVAGWFRIEAFRVDEAGAELPGSRRVAADWFQNLVTDIGLERIATASDFLTACRVGTGATAPAVTDTALSAQVGSAGSAARTSNVDTAQASAPYYAANTTTWRFPAGTATGNLSEVGVGWATTGATLFSRALILDSGGSPTTITVLSDEVLDVTYQFRIYPPTVDTSGTVTLDSISYGYTGRASNVTSASSWKVEDAAGFSTIIAYSGAIGAITSTPTGTTASGGSGADSAYSASSHVRQGVITWGLTAGNVAGGIRSIAYTHGFARYQVEFSPVIPKDGTKVLTLTLSHSWARKTI